MKRLLATVLCLLVGGTAPRLESRRFFQLSELTLDAQAQPSVIGARKVDPRLFAASFFSKDAQCTSSLVGPRALLLAAHCVTPGETIIVQVAGRQVSAVCTRAPEYEPVKNASADYALCLTADEIVETPYFETVNTDPSRLALDQEVLLTGFGCTKPGGGGDTSGAVYRVGEARITALPTATDNRIVTKGQAAVCYGDSGGPSFLQRITDGGPRIQVSVNSIGNIRDVSGLASLSTPVAKGFLTSWSQTHGVRICGIHPEQSKCRPFP
jgi:hypothetical protein